jgi:hypothetical protein
LNQFNISGHEYWKDNAASSLAWSKTVAVTDLTIIGGEPLSNPDVHNWVIGLRHCFPNVKDFKICTNGILINKHQHQIPLWWDLDVVLEISAHTETQYQTVLEQLKQIIGNRNIHKQTLRSDLFPEYYQTEYDTVFAENGQPRIIIAKAYEFYKWGPEKITKNQVHFHQNNAEQAHSNCNISTCHYIYQGDLYKCGTLVGAKELIKKYPVDANSKRLIEQYQPIRLTDPDLEQRIQDLQNSIPQCSLCPIDEQNCQIIQDSDIKKIQKP